MKVVINQKNLIPDESWQEFRKVRAVIENELGQIAITSEGNKIIFPGGKCENGEQEDAAIIREILEETGIEFTDSELKKVLEIETFDDEHYDFRTDSIIPRHTITTYYTAKTNGGINTDKQMLTEGEIKEKFEAVFVDKKTLYTLINENHNSGKNGNFFDNENKIVLENIINLR